MDLTDEEYIDLISIDIFREYQESTKLPLIKECVQHYYDELSKCYKKDDKATYAYSTLKLFDQTLVKWENNPDYKKITCKKGCSNCCHVAVIIRDSEADLLIELIKKEKIDPKTHRLKKQSKKTDEDFHDLSYKESKCIFLKNHECSIYEYRPLNCRCHNTLDESKYCDVKKYPRRKHQKFLPLEIMVIQRVVQLIEDVGYMSNQLLKRLK